MMIRRLAIALVLGLWAVPAAAQDQTGDPVAGQVLMTQMKCPDCHGLDGKGRAATPGVPRLDGQYEAYLVNQLFNFRDGRRPHKFMEIYTGRLDGKTVRNLAAFYACMGPDPVADPARCAGVR